MLMIGRDMISDMQLMPLRLLENSVGSLRRLLRRVLRKLYNGIWIIRFGATVLKMEATKGKDWG